MTKSSSDKNGLLKKGPWTPEEDKILIDYIHKYGHGKWRTLPKNAGLKRCGKSCRLRWANYLRPDIKRGRFSFEEEEAIIQLHSVLGNKWSTIAANLPGRTDNEIKNYWNTHIKKKLLKMGIDPVTHTPRLDVLQLASILNTSLYNSPLQFNYPTLSGIGRSVINPSQQLLSLLTTLLSYQSKNNHDALNHHNYHPGGNQLSGSISTLLQNQSQCSQMQLDSMQTFQTNQSHVSTQENHSAKSDSNPLDMEDHLMKANLEDQISPISTSFSHQNTLPNLWNYNNDEMQCLSSPKFNSIFNNLLGNENLCNNNEGMPNINLSSLLSSTPSSSSPSNLNNSSSSTTFVNGTTEDDRDTYGSNMLMYNISNALNLNDSGLL